MKNKLLNLPIFISVFLIFSYSCNKDDLNSNTVKDIDGNVYRTITIGTQVWMAENLKTTKYNDGTRIPEKPYYEWTYLSLGAFCNYNNNDSLASIYGRLYNWYAVNTGKLAPKGWHVPTEDDWNVLIDYLGGEAIAGGKLKQAGPANWVYPNLGATNETGFNALPGGDILESSFIHLGEYAFWWTSTSLYDGYASGHYLVYDENYIGTNNVPHYLGFSVRCIKD